MTRPAHRDPRFLALVFIGGAFGALARAGVVGLVPNELGAIAAVNIAGSLLLGLLLGVLAAIGPDDGPRRAVRLCLGTGFLGAFTTYSTFAGQLLAMSPRDDLGMLALVSFGSVIAGLAMAAAGLSMGTWLGRRVRSERPS